MKMLYALGSQRIVTILATLFFIEMAVFFAFNKGKVKVLILHSYTPSYSWARDIDWGISRALSDHETLLTISYHYMATKDADENQRRRAKKIALRRIEQLEPDFILAIDDNANGLVARHFVGHDSVNVIFAGVNGGVEQYGYMNASNVTGVFERKPVGAVAELIGIITPGKESASVIFVSDSSVSAKRDAEHMGKADWGQKISYKGHIAVNRFSEWKETILNLPNDMDYLLVGGYRTLKSDEVPGTRVPPAEVARWTERNSKQIVLGLNIFNSADGVPVSVGVSPYEQGEVAVGLLLRLIKSGAPAGSLAHVYPTQFLVSMNSSVIENQMYARVPFLLEAFARSTNNYFRGR